MTGRTRGWKGVVAVHSWIVIKGENDRTWRRYDVAGWGNPVRLNWWPPDLWFGQHGSVILDLKGERAQALIPRIEAAIKSLSLRQRRRLSNLAGAEQQHVRRRRASCGAGARRHACRRTRSAATIRPWPYAGLTDSGTGVEANLWGVLGVKLGWVEGVELNVLGLVAGLDVRHPAVKVPGYGRVGFEHTATAASRL